MFAENVHSEFNSISTTGNSRKITNPKQISLSGSKLVSIRSGYCELYE